MSPHALDRVVGSGVHGDFVNRIAETSTGNCRSDSAALAVPCIESRLVRARSGAVASAALLAGTLPASEAVLALGELPQFLGVSPFIERANRGGNPGLWALGPWSRGMLASRISAGEQLSNVDDDSSHGTCWAFPRASNSGPLIQSARAIIIWDRRGWARARVWREILSPACQDSRSGLCTFPVCASVSRMVGD